MLKSGWSQQDLGGAGEESSLASPERVGRALCLSVDKKAATINEWSSRTQSIIWQTDPTTHLDIGTGGTWHE